ncbi:MAG: hypothetical protein KGL02_15235 [Acidobacteriota bacterium]|nr:hypothetical protein [Acidobacteriota bacterium]
MVCVFAAAGDVLRPKNFAGIFSAAPAVSLATLTLTVLHQGKHFASMEARSMIGGGFALAAYAWLCTRLMGKDRVHAFRATVSGIALWAACALGLWAVWLR